MLIRAPPLSPIPKSAPRNGSLFARCVRSWRSFSGRPPQAIEVNRPTFPSRANKYLPAFEPELADRISPPQHPHLHARRVKETRDLAPPQATRAQALHRRARTRAHRSPRVRLLPESRRAESRTAAVRSPSLPALNLERLPDFRRDLFRSDEGKCVTYRKCRVVAPAK